MERQGGWDIGISHNWVPVLPHCRVGGALVGAGTPGNQGQGHFGGQIAMLVGDWDGRRCRGWGHPHQCQVAGWVRRGIPQPQPWGARKMLTWHHGGCVAQGGEGEHVP